MNLLLFPTLLIGSGLFAFGLWIGQRAKHIAFISMGVLGILLALPGVLFATYYLKCFHEPIWLYQFRSIPFTELTAGGAGFLPGMLHGKFSGNERFTRIAGRWFFPIILLLGLIVPYLKPLLRPPHWNEFEDRWSEDVCLQTSESSCGPACAATLLRGVGQMATEQELAREAFTSRNGTENWYLARAFRRRGVNVEFSFEPDLKKPWLYPSIAGVRLPASGNTGHFITILDRMGDQYVIGDPLEGRLTHSLQDLQSIYQFTGFFMVVE